MSGTTIDQKVVEMRFDNSKFESNVSTTLSTLDKLKQKLNFSGAAKGFNDVQSAANKCNMSGLSGAVETVQAKFSAMQVMAITALSNITNSAVNAGKNIVNALTLQPVIDGFQEYETQINAVQTILANTQKEGTNIDTVNSALDTLNAYADKTIYNFTEMTRNIGTFTAAGVNLQTSVDSIQGIANLAAVSGSTSQQASTAMYQLSQAIAAGKVQLMDWNSVVNAGMGGQVFQDALIRTSEHLQTGAKQAIETYGSFRESLTKGEWLTTEVLTETLKQFSLNVDSAEDYAKAMGDLVAQGYTEEEAKQIVEMAKTATDAATKVKTFSQLIDTLKEALGSGWAQTWRIVVGDFEEAKELFTEISDVLSGAINESSQARNNLLQGWSDLGGRAALVESLKNVFEGLVSVMKPIKEAFSEIFPPATAEQLFSITEAIRDFTAKLKLSDEASAKLKSTFKGLFSVLDMVFSTIKTLAKGILTPLGSLSSLGGMFLTLASSIGDFVSKLREGTKASGIFEGIISGLSTVLSGAIEAITSFGQSGTEKLTSVFSGLGDVILKVGNAIGKVFGNLKENLSKVFTGLDYQDFLNTFNSGVLSALLLSVRSFIQQLTGSFKQVENVSIFDGLKDFANNIQETVSGTLDAVRGSLETWQTSLKANVLLKLAIAIAILAGSLVALSMLDKDKMIDALGAITTLFIELSAAMKVLTTFSFDPKQLTAIGTLIGLAVAVSILAGAMKKIAGLNSDEIERGVAGIAGLVAVLTVASIALSGKSGMALKGAAAMVIFAAAIKILASVAEDMAKLGWEEMMRGLGGVALLITAIGVFLKKAKLDSGMFKAAVGILSISIALKVLASACKDFASMGWTEMGQGLLGVGASLGMFAAFTHLVDTKDMIKTAISIGILAVSLSLLVPSFERLAALSFEQTITAIVAIGGSLKVLSTIMNTLSDKDLISMSVALPSIASALVVVAEAFEKLGKLSPKQIGMGVVAIVSAIGMLCLAIKALPEKDLWQTAAALPAITSAIMVLAEGMERLSKLSEDEMSIAMETLAGALILLIGAVNALDSIKDAAGILILASALLVLSIAISMIGKTGIVGAIASILAIAGTLTAIGVAAKFLKPIKIIALALSITSLAISFMALGVGLAAIGTGFATVVTSFVGAIVALQGVSLSGVLTGLIALAGVFTIIGVAAKLLKPAVPEIIKMAASLTLLSLSALAIATSISLLVASLMVLSAIGQEQVASIVATLKALILGISEMIPEILTSLINSAKVIILGLMSALVEMAPQLIQGILQILVQTVQSLAQYAPEIVGYLLDFVITLLDNLTQRAPEVVNSLVNFVVALLTALSTRITDLLTPVLAIISAIFTGLAEALGPIVETVLAPILTILKDLIVGVFEVIAPYLPQITDAIARVAEAAAPAVEAIAHAFDTLFSNLAPILNAIANIIAALGGAITSILGGITGVLYGVAGVFDSVFNGISSVVTSVGDSIKKVLDSIADVAKSFGDSIKTSLDGVSGVFDSVFHGISDVVTSVGDSIKSVLDGISGVIDSIGEAALNAGTGFKYLAEGIEIITGLNVFDMGVSLGAVAVALGDIAAHSSGLSEAGWGMQQIAESTNLSATAFTVITSGVVMLVSTLPMIGSSATESMNVLKFAVESSASCFTVLSDQVASAASNVIGSLSSIVASAQTFGGNVSVLMGVMDSVMASMVSAVYNGGSQISMAMTSIMLSMIGIVAGNGGSISAAMNSIMNSMVGVVISSTGQISAAVISMMVMFVGTINSQGVAVIAAFSMIMVMMIRAASSQSASFAAAGNMLMNNFKMGLTNGLNGVNSAIQSVLNSCSGAIRGYQWQFRDAGGYLGDGLVRGINAKQNDVYWAGYNLGRKAVEGENKGQESNSPSKLMIKAGKWIGEGLVIGMDRMVNDVYESGKLMGETAVDGVSNALDKIDLLSSDFDDIQPAISPVVDMSNVGYQMGQFQLGTNMDTLTGISTNMIRTRSESGTTINNRDDRTINVSLNYSASDNAQTMFKQLVRKLEMLDNVKG